MQPPAFFAVPYKGEEYPLFPHPQRLDVVILVRGGTRLTLSSIQQCSSGIVKVEGLWYQADTGLPHLPRVNWETRLLPVTAGRRSEAIRQRLLFQITGEVFVERDGPLFKVAIPLLRSILWQLNAANAPKRPPVPEEELAESEDDLFPLKLTEVRIPFHFSYEVTDALLALSLHRIPFQAERILPEEADLPPVVPAEPCEGILLTFLTTQPGRVVRLFPDTQVIASQAEEDSIPCWEPS